MEKYFGTNEEILAHALKFLKEGNRSAAKELNKTVKIFGSDIDAKLVLDKIYSDFTPRSNPEQQKQQSSEHYEECDSMGFGGVVFAVIFGYAVLSAIFG